MDQYLRFLFKRALAEDSAESWRNYALTLQKTCVGSSTYDLTPKQELELFANTIHNVLEGFAINPPFLSIPESDHYIYVTREHKDSEYISVNGYIIFTGDASDGDYATIGELVEQTITLHYSNNVFHIPLTSERFTYSREVRDSYSYLLCSFEMILTFESGTSDNNDDRRDYLAFDDIDP